MKFLALALAGAFVAGAASAATYPGAQTMYQAAVTATSCSGQSSCTLTFSTIPASTLATIEHVSCSANVGNYESIYLGLLYAKSNPSVADSFSALSFVSTGSNAESVASTPTTFFVSGSDAPVITVYSSGAFSSEPICLVSGYTSKQK